MPRPTGVAMKLWLKSLKGTSLRDLISLYLTPRMGLRPRIRSWVRLGVPLGVPLGVRPGVFPGFVRGTAVWTRSRGPPGLETSSIIYWNIGIVQPLKL